MYFSFLSRYLGTESGNFFQFVELFLSKRDENNKQLSHTIDIVRDIDWRYQSH